MLFGDISMLVSDIVRKNLFPDRKYRSEYIHSQYDKPIY